MTVHEFKTRNKVLERIFSHGLKKRNSQSALWSFLTEFKVYAGPEVTEEQIDPNYATEGLLTSFAKRVAGLDYKRDIRPPSRSPVGDMNTILR